MKAMLNKTQKEMIINAYHNFGFDYCLTDAMLRVCVESATHSKKSVLEVDKDIEQYLFDYDQVCRLSESGKDDLAKSYAELYL